LRDYRRVFKSCFAALEIEVLSREPEAFDRVKPYLRPEFVSGNLEEDAVTLIRVVASQPVS
jgi:hypothetical protein